jgi:hypothetical protein
MKGTLSFIVSIFLLASASVLAQREGEHRANGGRIPPPPSARQESGAMREAERLPDGRLDSSQHVNKDRWFGHDAPNDARFHVEHLGEHGIFNHAGPAFQYRVGGIDAATHRFWFTNGSYFEVAAWDWNLASDWCWRCADDYVVYEDPDHPGWYLFYSMETGVYVHVQYLGAH